MGQLDEPGATGSGQEPPWQDERSDGVGAANVNATPTSTPPPAAPNFTLPTPGYPPAPGYPPGAPQAAQPPYNPYYPPYPNYPGSPYPPTPATPGAYPGYLAYPAPSAVYPPPTPAPLYGGADGAGLGSGAPGQPVYPDYRKAYEQFEPPKPPKPPRRRSSRRGAALVGAGITLLVVIAVLGAVVYGAVGVTGVRVGPFVLGPQEQISGNIYGMNLASSEQGTFIAQAIAAQITCAGETARSDASGAYSLTVPGSDEYHCVVAAPPTYAPFAVTIVGQGTRPLTVNFGSSGPQAAPSGRPGSCATSYRGTLVSCAAVPLTPAVAHGVVTNAATGQLIPNANVTCWNDDAALAKSDGSARLHHHHRWLWRVSPQPATRYLRLRWR